MLFYSACVRFSAFTSTFTWNAVHTDSWLGESSISPLMILYDLVGVNESSEYFPSESALPNITSWSTWAPSSPTDYLSAPLFSLLECSLWFHKPSSIRKQPALLMKIYDRVIKYLTKMTRTVSGNLSALSRLELGLLANNAYCDKRTLSTYQSWL